VIGPGQDQRSGAQTGGGREVTAMRRPTAKTQPGPALLFGFDLLALSSALWGRQAKEAAWNTPTRAIRPQDAFVQRSVRF
jgi:hypothetical protein